MLNPLVIVITLLSWHC